MMRSVSAALVALASLATTGSAQSLYVGRGSTPQGDYLRGVGVAAIGLGQYNLNTAMADSIVADTDMRVDSYIREIIANENRLRAKRRAEQFAKGLRLYAGIRKRILDNPGEFEIRMGDAQNALLDRLNQGRFSTSDIRYNPILLPIDIVRRIPFKLGEEGAVLSLPRLRHEGKAAWPPAFQDDKYFLRERTEYDRAMSNAMDEQIEGKISLEAVARLENAVVALSLQLDRVMLKRGMLKNDKRYTDGRLHIRQLEQSCNQIKSHKIQVAMVDLDLYEGTTVDNLRLFMLKHKLGFAPAERPDEREAYRVIYTALAAQREALDPDAREAGK